MTTLKKLKAKAADYASTGQMSNQSQPVGVATKAAQDNSDNQSDKSQQPKKDKGGNITFATQLKDKGKGSNIATLGAGDFTATQQSAPTMQSVSKHHKYGQLKATSSFRRT